MLVLPCHVQVGGIFEGCVDEIDLVRTALSCHFALDFTVLEDGGLVSPHNALLGTIALGRGVKGIVTCARTCLSVRFRTRSKVTATTRGTGALTICSTMRC